MSVAHNLNCIAMGHEAATSHERELSLEVGGRSPRCVIRRNSWFADEMQGTGEIEATAAEATRTRITTFGVEEVRYFSSWRHPRMCSSESIFISQDLPLFKTHAHTHTHVRVRIYIYISRRMRSASSTPSMFSDFLGRARKYSPERGPKAKAGSLAGENGVEAVVTVLRGNEYGSGKRCECVCEE